MDAALYENIVYDLNHCKLPHVNDNIINFISSKYPNVSLETLRSIIGLWYTRRIASISSRMKDINVYKMYKGLVDSGNMTACLSIAEKSGYPPALIAKMVLTSYMAEMRQNKPKTDVKKAKQLRKTLCPYCVDRKNATSVNNADGDTQDEDTPIKKHNDPRIELALNLFDEDDDIGKYFLEKFKYSRDDKNASFTKSAANSKSNKFYWQASSFEQMGEKNVMRCKNIERLFANPNSSSFNVNEASEPAKQINGINEALMKRAMPNSRDTLVKSPVKSVPVSITTKRPSYRIKDLLNDFGDMQVANEDSTKPSTVCSGNNFPTEDPPEYPPSPDNTYRCTCKSWSSSEDSDSDEDSEETWENLNVRELLENTSLIEDPILANDVLICTTYDDQYGPTSDIISNSLGVIYERILEDHVKKAGLPYRTENKLRDVGVDKTPDIILLVPVAVDGFVINWIESKALFADYKQHQLFKRSQFKNYTNRFGPGFVIYWHGYVDDIPELYLAKKEIIVRDTFPSKESFTFVKSDKFKSWMQSESN